MEQAYIMSLALKWGQLFLLLASLFSVWCIGVDYSFPCLYCYLLCCHKLLIFQTGYELDTATDSL